MNVTLRAPAKLTWTLEITGRRADGYHLLRSEMVSLDLADVLEIDESTSGIVVRDDDGLLRDVVLLERDNLVTRALELAGKSAGVVLHKRIPVGGGLGGGSSDAAAILRWADVRDLAATASLGGDVPFCVVGGRALVEGVGEVVTPLPYERREITLVLPSFGISTPACYQAFDDMWASGWRPRGRNHLFEPACVVEPRLAAVAQFVEERTGRTVELCGSGSTLFIEGHWRDEASWGETGPAGTLRFVRTVTTPAEGD